MLTLTEAPRRHRRRRPARRNSSLPFTPLLTGVGLCCLARPAFAGAELRAPCGCAKTVGTTCTNSDEGRSAKYCSGCKVVTCEREGRVDGHWQRLSVWIAAAGMAGGALPLQAGERHVLPTKVPSLVHTVHCRPPCIAADCSKRCQESHWPLDKRECAQLRQAAEDNRVPEQQVYGTSRGRGGSGAGGSSGAAAGSGGASSSRAGEAKLVRPMCGLCGNRKVGGSLVERACV